jgi:hypothetical protein
MDLTLFNFTTVILGEFHNPTILNPDFLSGQNIVPKGWGWEVAETITTPPLALVRYENGVSIRVEQHKLQLGDPNVEKGPGESKLAEIAAGYVTTLPHVRYTAVGTNFHGFIEMSDPAGYLTQHFLKDGSWNNEQHPLHAVGFRLVYMLEGGCRSTLSIDFGEVKPEAAEEKKPAILVTGNFHRECAEQPGPSDVEKHLKQVFNDWDTFQTLVRDTVQAGE